MASHSSSAETAAEGVQPEASTNGHLPGVTLAQWVEADAAEREEIAAQYGPLVEHLVREAGAEPDEIEVLTEVGQAAVVQALEKVVPSKQQPDEWVPKVVGCDVWKALTELRTALPPEEATQRVNEFLAVLANPEISLETFKATESRELNAVMPSAQRYLDDLFEADRRAARLASPVRQELRDQLILTTMCLARKAFKATEDPDVAEELGGPLSEQPKAVLRAVCAELLERAVEQPLQESRPRARPGRRRVGRRSSPKY